MADGRPSLKKDTHVAETIMALSGTTNGSTATQVKTLEKRNVGQLMHDLAAEHEGKQITFADTQGRARAGHHQPGVVRLGVRRAPVLPSPSTSSGLPWLARTLTGRQHFYLDHDWMQEPGEGPPVAGHRPT